MRGGIATKPHTQGKSPHTRGGDTHDGRMFTLGRRHRGEETRRGQGPYKKDGVVEEGQLHNEEENHVTREAAHKQERDHIGRGLSDREGERYVETARGKSLEPRKRWLARDGIGSLKTLITFQAWT